MKKFSKNLLAVGAFALAGILSGCGEKAQDGKTSDLTINGAGASFPAPVYRKWLYSYKKQTGVTINYQSVGSGAGIRQISAKTVDFGASDKPLKKAELDEKGLIQFPMLMGGVVPVVNIPGVKPGELSLSGSVLGDIFLGKVTNWNDEAIKKTNPTVNLPNLPITVVHRSDGSGTTWIFTNYLTKVSENWSNGPGTGKAVEWPVGVGGQKNPGVANNVLKISGSIGYVEYTYATEANMSFTSLVNKDGNIVAPSQKTFSAAGANADWDNAPGFYMVLTDQAGENTWPITGVTYILMYKKQENAELAQGMLDYFTWSYKNGAPTAQEMNYIAIPENVVAKVKQKWSKEITGLNK